MSIFNVELKKVVDDTYDIEIGYNLSDTLVSDLENGLAGKIKKFAVITDTNVRDPYALPICEKIKHAGYSVDLFVFPAGEKSKSRETKAKIEDAMLKKGYRRDCCIIAVGGGGKTAIDTPLATNTIGLFNQPQKVYIDIAAWKTLPQRQMASGMAETIKHACLGSEDMFEFIEENLDDIYSFKKFACEYIAENNCRIKYNVVMKDEREAGLRETLNLGHTVGRAIETVSDYKLLHGEALSIGMAAQALMSARLGYMSEEQAERVIKLYERAGLPTRIPDYIDREELVKKLYTDKKVRDGKLRFVLQKGIGATVEFAPGVYAKPIEESLAREIIMEL